MPTAALADKVVIVTGGSRGIGRAIVLGAVAQGARVVFCARAIGPEAEAIQAEAEGRARAVRADISSEQDVDALFDATLEAFGRVDVVVNNAGSSRAHLLVSLPPAAWDEILSINLTGPFLMARRAIREFLRQGEGGRIVSLGSITQNGAPSNVSYAASKGGLEGLARLVARQYGAQGIVAHTVAAGYVETELMREAPDLLKHLAVEACPQKRSATPDEVAAAVLFLASARSAALANGSTLFASGGLLDLPPATWKNFAG